jgi:hypothetical protein
MSTLFRNQAGNNTRESVTFICGDWRMSFVVVRTRVEGYLRSQPILSTAHSSARRRVDSVNSLNCLRSRTDPRPHCNITRDTDSSAGDLARETLRKSVTGKRMINPVVGLGMESRCVLAASNRVENLGICGKSTGLQVSLAEMRGCELLLLGSPGYVRSHYALFRTRGC